MDLSWASLIACYLRKISLVYLFDLSVSHIIIITIMIINIISSISISVITIFVLITQYLYVPYICCTQTLPVLVISF